MGCVVQTHFQPSLYWALDYYIGRDVPIKGALFSEPESVWNREVGVVIKHFKNTCLERGPCLSGKGLKLINL